MCDIFITENFMQNWILKFNFLWCLNYLLSGSSPNIVITPGPIWILLRICLAAAKTYRVFFYVIPRICSLNLFCASLNSFPHAGKKRKTFLTTAMAFFCCCCFPWFSVPAAAPARGPSAPIAGRSSPSSDGRLAAKAGRRPGLSVTAAHHICCLRWKLAHAN